MPKLDNLIPKITDSGGGSGYGNGDGYSAARLRLLDWLIAKLEAET